MTAEERPRRLTRAETKARTRSLLLDAAAQVFARKGFGGASVDDIAETAGFTTGALYANFKSKEALFLELLSTRNNNRMSEVESIVTGEDGLAELRESLNRWLVDVTDGDADLAPLQAEMWLYAIRRPTVLAELAAQFAANRDSLSSVLAERARAGKTSKTQVDPAHVATVLMALFQGLVQLRRTDPALVPETLYGDAAHWLFGGLARDAEQD